MRLSSILAAAAAALFLLPASALAVDFVWTTELVHATRFSDADSSEVGEVEKGKRVELLATDGERVRIRVAGAKFGWVDKAKVSETEPAAEEGDESEGEDAPAE